MSIKVQSDPVPSGAQEPLSAENEQRSRSGFVGSQNPHAAAIGRGEQVDLGGAPGPVSPNNKNGAASRPSESVNQMSVGGRDVVVRHVDQRCVEGSYSGDSRAQGSPAVLPKNPAPREGMGQARLSSKQD